MKVLAIETSCDETAVSVCTYDNIRVTILSNIVASSSALQAKYGGIIPEQAAREQIRSIMPVLKESLEQTKLSMKDIDSIAVTVGPGLIGSLLVGVETAKILSLTFSKPLIAINHLIAHFYANWIEQRKTHPDMDDFTPVTFPFIGLLISGGHSDILLFENHGKYIYLGGTRDDAAGETFDKSARLLGLPYPGGPQIAKLAKEGNPKAYKLPRPMHDSGDFDFSFSGLKTAVSNLITKTDINEINLRDLCASIQQASIDTLLIKTIRAAQANGIEKIILAGGVASNEELVNQFRNKFSGTIIAPPPYLCTDNAAMTAAAAFFEKPVKDIIHLQANPNLSL
jgi:N6-L-threonylcarbamoyladenine synthase